MSQVEQVNSDAPVPALGVGDQLKAAREARRMSLGEVSQAIKISPRVLEQVEANAWGEMPGHTFARGMVRSYAKLLQIDPEPLLKSLEDAPLPKLPMLDIPSPTQAALPVAGQARRQDRLTIAAGVLLVVLAVLAYFIVPDNWLEKGSDNLASPEGSLASPPATLVPPVSPIAPNASGEAVSPPAMVPAAPGGEGQTVPSLGGPAGAATGQGQPIPLPPPVPMAPPPAQPVPPPPAAAFVPAAPVPAPAPVAPPAMAPQPVPPPAPPAAAPATPAKPAASTGLELRFGDASWVEVKDKNGAVLLAGTFDSGISRHLRGDGPYSVSLGNAGGVGVWFRGKPVDLKPHTRQNVARFTLE